MILWIMLYFIIGFFAFIFFLIENDYQYFKDLSLKNWISFITLDDLCKAFVCMFLWPVFLIGLFLMFLSKILWDREWEPFEFLRTKDDEYEETIFIEDKIKVIRICSNCNKEFEVTQTSADTKEMVLAIHRCPHCDTMNHLWMRIILKEY
jgi:DNA-directed RNA polymerase subunit RPC12/RpoP